MTSAHSNVWGSVSRLVARHCLQKLWVATPTFHDSAPSTLCPGIAIFCLVFRHFPNTLIRTYHYIHPKPALLHLSNHLSHSIRSWEVE